MNIYEDLLSKHNNYSGKINTVEIVSGLVIQNNIFKSKITVKESNEHNNNNNKNNNNNIYFKKVCDLVPLINSLFNNDIICFNYFFNETIYIENKILDINKSYDYYSNVCINKHQKYYENKLIDYSFLKTQFLEKEIKNKKVYINDYLIKYKKNTKLSFLKFNNLKYFNRKQNNHIFEWILCSNIKFTISFYKNDLSIKIQIPVQETKFTNKKKNDIKKILLIYEKINNYINSYF